MDFTMLVSAQSSIAPHYENVFCLTGPNSVKFDGYQLISQSFAKKGVVAYRVTQDGTGAPVELRVVQPETFADWPSIRRRLQLAAMVVDPNVLRVLEFDPDHDPPFVAVELVECRTFEDALSDQRPIPTKLAAKYSLAIARALAEAHRLGLEHGEIVPDSIHLRPDDTVMLDFAMPGDSIGNDRTDDVRELGLLMMWLTSERLGELREVTESMLATEPTARPSIHQVVLYFEQQFADAWETTDPETGGTSESTPLAADKTTSSSHEKTSIYAPADQPSGTVVWTGELPTSTPVPLAHREQLGRFRLLDRIGEGGMGSVYKAQDLADESIVALKTIRANEAANAESLQRFHKEARMLSEMNSPYVANLLEINEDAGIHYMAIEFVEGDDLSNVVKQRGQLPEAMATVMIADVARALTEAHERGIVHRDLKPGNILLLSDGENWPPRVKLTDFGLARHIEESESLELTKTGTLLGTPLYMPPEQCSDMGLVDARSDIYSLGATLFHLLAGQPPFQSSSIAGLIAKHCNSQAPPVREFAPNVSEGIQRIVAKCLEKKQDMRYQDASTLLADLVRLSRGEPTSIRAHPQIPEFDDKDVLSFDFEWQLNTSAEELWPHVSNTERFNRAVGLPDVNWSSQPNESGGSRRSGHFKKLGMDFNWQEHPFEWIEGRRMGVLRVYDDGPAKWMTSIVELSPRDGGGTTLTHRIHLLPTNFLGRTAAKIEVGVKTRKSFDRVYRRIDAVTSGQLGGGADPFEEFSTLRSSQQRRLDELLQRLIECGVEPVVVEALGEFISTAAAQDVSRIRPLALARLLSLDSDQVLAACLFGTREGLFTLLWDILCPICRIPSQVKDTLKELDQHGHCEACYADFELDFANSIELIFRVNSEIRPGDTGVYCIGGPAHSPHVVAQIRLAPQECFDLDLNLTEGAYRLRGPQLPFVLDFRVDPKAGTNRWKLDLAQGPDPDLPRSLKSGDQLLSLFNDHTAELVVRIERVASRTDAVTAARAASTALFRELFPGECLTPGQLVSIENVTFLATDLQHGDRLYHELGDARAFERIHHQIRKIDEIVRVEGGTLVKTIGEGVLAVFHEPVSAVRAALAVQKLEENDLKIVVHRGPAMVTTLNDQLDYFGTTVNTTHSIVKLVRGSQPHITDAIAGNEQVAALLAKRSLTAKTAEFDGKSLPLVFQIV